MTVTTGESLYRSTGAFVEELVRSGVHHACVCPGSRSTPLAVLLKRNGRLRVWTHLDERSSAYFALGLAKALRSPVAVLTTSGTAAVNLAPAVVEAHYSRVPLLLLTADRPPELRDVGALQTIDQQRLFGSHVKWFQEVLLPEATDETTVYARTLACRAVAIASAAQRGPVHLNFPFREPLIPTDPGSPPGGRGDTPFVSVVQSPRRFEPVDLVPTADELATSRRGVIVCGPHDVPGFPEAASELAATLGYPLLADPTSQARCGPHHDRHILGSYDTFLRDESVFKELTPEVALRFGATPVSRPLLRYLQHNPAVPQIVVDDGGNWSDPMLVASRVIQADPTTYCRALIESTKSGRRGQRHVASPWLRRWQELDSLAGTTAKQGLDGHGLSEPAVFLDLANLLPEGTTVFAGNSMPVRCLDSFFPPSDRPLRFLANRGANGIDGVVSTALGVAAATSGRLVLVIGDISLYHDMNGLLAAGKQGLSATIVLLNNDGGGIFSFLPQAERVEHFEELFGTPHGLDFSHAARMYGLGYSRPSNRTEFREEVSLSLDGQGVDLIEVVTDRKTNVELHRQIWSAVASSRSSANGGRSP